MGKRKSRIIFEDLDPELEKISATDAKNTFGGVLREILRGAKYQVDRNGSPVAVIINFDRFSDLANAVAHGEHARTDEILGSLHEWTATDAKNKFGGLLDEVLGGGRIAVRRNSRLQGVILDYNDYHRLWRQVHSHSEDGDDGAAADPNPSTISGNSAESDSN